jgi:DnaJ-class molecular chaperone
VPAWSSSDKVLRLKGRACRKAGGHGDLYVHVRIMLPDGDAELEALMRLQVLAAAIAALEGAASPMR